VVDCLSNYDELGKEERVFFIFIVFSSPFGSFWKLADEIMVKLIGMWQMVLVPFLGNILKIP
jgi:hypothetical protein